MIWQHRKMGNVLIALIGAVALAVSAQGQTYETAVQAYLVQDYKTARKELEALGEAITPEGKYLLGSEYVRGQGGRHRIDQGMKLIHDAAASGNPSAMLYLGKTFVDGDHRYSNPDEARSYLTALASDGNADAKALLARLPQGSSEPSPQKDIVADADPVDASTIPNNAPPRSESVQHERATLDPVPPAVDLLRDLHPDDTTATPSLITPGRTAEMTSAKRGPAIIGWVAAIVGTGLLYYLFSGVKCPKCGKRRVSKLVSQKKLDQYTTTRMRTITENTTHRSSFGTGSLQTGSSHKTRQVPVTVTIREFLNSYRCGNCEHEFQRNVSHEM